MNIVTNVELEKLEAVIERAVSKAIARAPRPTQVNLTQAGEMLNVSRTTVSRLVRAGKLRLNGCGLIPIGQIDAILESHSTRTTHE